MGSKNNISTWAPQMRKVVHNGSALFIRRSCFLRFFSKASEGKMCVKLGIISLLFSHVNKERELLTGTGWGQESVG